MEEQRLTKLEKIKKQGKNPYPNHFCPTHTAAQIQASWGALEGEELEKKPSVKLAGRILALRSFGKAAFVHIQDRTGKIQAYVAKDVLGDEAFSSFSELVDIGDIIGVEGTLFRTKTKELTLKVNALELLAKSLYPLPEKWHGLTDVEARYRQRYLDLIVNPKVREIFQKRSQIIQHIRQFFLDREYLEVETPMMHPIAGGALAKPFVTHHNTLDMDLYLRVAPELYLKRLLVGGFERVFEINRNFRNEGISIQHNPEFTMIEFYEAYATYENFITL
ncbi:MAG: lysine--tRNA ligase, partial [Deltaproteobacteria bacterium]|nr:lysine--tRNA ligase [Deltaproteobacteria bacterium]